MWLTHNHPEKEGNFRKVYFREECKNILNDKMQLNVCGEWTFNKLQYIDKMIKKKCGFLLMILKSCA